MDLILAADLKNGCIVHGKSGNRDEYRPIVSALASTAEPVRYLQEIGPRYLYAADLDRITNNGGHDPLVPALAGCVDLIMLDRGCRSPDDFFIHPKVINVVGTETAGPDIEAFTGGYLSVDMKDGRVIPSGSEPEQILHQAGDCAFEGCIILDIAGVGTRRGLDPALLDRCRAAYPNRLLWGGGIACMDDLYLLQERDYDGAIIATALHTGAVHIDLIRSGHLC